MGDLIELQSHVERIMGPEASRDFEEFLVNDGLKLLADFRSIRDQSVRDAITNMVSRIAACQPPTAK